MGRAIASDGDPKGCRGRAESHPASMTRDSFAARNYPLVGIDAPTPAREKGLQPYGALTLFFRWRKKSVQKKASGTATPEKSPLLPIFERGSSQCRAQHSWIAIPCCRARSCSLFSSFKKGKAFSLRCLSPLCSPAVGGWQAPPCRLGCFVVAGRFCGVDKWADFLFPAVGVGQAYPLKGKMVSVTGLFCRLNERRLLLSSRSAWSIRSPCRDSASVAVDGGQAYPLAGRFWKALGQRIWGREP